MNLPTYVNEYACLEKYRLGYLEVMGHQVCSLLLNGAKQANKQTKKPKGNGCVDQSGLQRY